MAVQIRTVFISGAVAVFVAGAIASPAIFPGAFAAEPQKHILDTASEMFPKPFNPKSLRKFDILVDDSVSTKPLRTEVVSKIGFGQRSTVAIVTTSSGTYSSDAIASPYVRYPGIDVLPKEDEDYDPRHHSWFGVATSPYGTRTWSQITNGSFTVITSTFTPTKRNRG